MAWWLRALVALGLLYFLEEVLLSSIGYTILPGEWILADGC